jgi:hypothetical protein
MIKLLSVEYLTRKEAAHRYGFSMSWFEQRQRLHDGPPFIKIRGKGKAYYPLHETDNWFKENIKESD